MLPVAVDAMGGDHAPAAIIAGAREDSERLGIPVVLVGAPDQLHDIGSLPVIAASEVIGMGDDAAHGVRRKKDSSLVRAAEAVRDGRACAMVSAGNTGATMASALLRMGRIRGVNRPAIAIPIPIPGTTPTILLDAGANSEVQPEWLVQFAQMGSVYARFRFGIDAPRVGILSIGEEAGKGNTLVKTAHDLLADAPRVRFIGNVEGRDLMTDDVDVVVTDGFTGNVVLKTLEGARKAILSAIDEVLTSTEANRAANAVVRPDLDALYTVIDAETYGGAVLLGVDGVCIISHGSSTPRAIVGAVQLAHDMVQAGLVDALRLAIAPSDLAS
jgi:glycerol-3-phosphate acyltransferase PlsX